MTQIFVSHSQKDKEIRQNFSDVFAVTGVKSVYMEFEEIEPPAWETIRNKVGESDAVFLLLGSNIRQSIHTQNWVAFEVGMACSMGKDVWIFEHEDADVEFPIPYLTDYGIWHHKNLDHFKYVRKIVEGYANLIKVGKRSKITYDGLRRLKGIPLGKLFMCKHSSCKTSYRLHLLAEACSFRCPSCRKPVEIASASCQV